MVFVVLKMSELGTCLMDSAIEDKGLSMFETDRETMKLRHGLVDKMVCVKMLCRFSWLSGKRLLIVGVNMNYMIFNL